MAGKKDEPKKERFEQVIQLRNAKIIYRNFSGKTSNFNKNGFRTFNVLLPTEVAENLDSHGWNIKWLEPREEGDDRQAHTEVKVQYGGPQPPKIVTVTGRNKTVIDEDTVGLLDHAYIDRVDIAIRPYNWSMPSGEYGVKGYVKTMYVTLLEDEFEAEYAFDERVD